MLYWPEHATPPTEIEHERKLKKEEKKNDGEIDLVDLAREPRRAWELLLTSLSFAISSSFRTAYVRPGIS